MPSMANITVKKADGTTDIVYAALNPSSGDKVSALWRNETGGASASLRPTFNMVSQWNGARTARRVSVSFQYPFTVTDSTTSITTVKARVPFEFTITIPAEVPDTAVAEAVAQGTNLMVSTLVRDCLKVGFAPT
jgi:hypothetical protein